jgi:hypothetical protein
MDAHFLRQMMIAKLKEFSMYHQEYENLVQPRLNFIDENLEPAEKSEFKQFMIERPDLEQWSSDMIHEINHRTETLQSYYQHAFELHRKKGEQGNGMLITHNEITVQRQHLPHGSVILSLGYNSDAGVLDVEFSNHKVYRYFDVPMELLKSIDKDKAGSALNRLIKGKFKTECIRG